MQAELKFSDYHALWQKMWDRLVPKNGQAVSVQGELVRIIGRMTDELV
jgi:hypothetical protein